MTKIIIDVLAPQGDCRRFLIKTNEATDKPLELKFILNFSCGLFDHEDKITKKDIQTIALSLLENIKDKRFLQHNEVLFFSDEKGEMTMKNLPKKIKASFPDLMNIKSDIHFKLEGVCSFSHFKHR